jgi:hypothetical protein
MLVLIAGIYLTVDNSWRSVRQMTREELVARANHFDKLRPLLAGDADWLDSIGRSIDDQGYAAPLIEEPPDNDGVWYPQLLIRDFESHFKPYFSDREELRQNVRRLDTDFRALLRSVEDRFNLPADLRERSQVLALSTVRQCLGKGDAARLARTRKGYHFSTGLGGSEYSDTHPPPASLVVAFAAYQQFKPDGRFDDACADLRLRAVPIREEAARLALEARRLATAEQGVLKGDCPYLPKAR